jgi:hypothetical protein
MKRCLLSLVLPVFLCAPLFAQGEGGPEDPIEALKKILAKMETVEKLLAKTRLEEGAAGQAEIEKELEELIKAGKLKQGEVLDDVAKQLKAVVDRMKDIDLEIEKIIQNVQMSQNQGQGSSGMEIKKPGGEKDQDQSKGKREEEQKNLQENNPGEEKKGDPAKGESEEKKEGEKKGGDGGKSGNDPAKKPYTAPGSEPPGGARRAAGEGRWGFLPPKEFQERLAQGKIKVPGKYEALVRKFWEMLSKKAEEEK